MKSIYSGISLALVSVLLSACGSSALRPDSNPVHQLAVWSADGAGIAVAEPGPNDNTHRIVLYDAEGKNRTPLTEQRPYRASRLYYLKDSDYLVVESLIGEQSVKFDRINLDGHEITIIETRKPAQSLCESSGVTVPTSVLPSPDGKLLAYIYSPACNEVTVEFLRARNLQTTDSQNLSLEQSVTPTWHPGGYLILAASDGKTAWQLTPNQEIASTLYPRCLSPQTRSAAINQDGRLVEFRDGQVQISDAGSQPAFGCQ